MYFLFTVFNLLYLYIAYYVCNSFRTFEYDIGLMHNYQASYFLIKIYNIL